MPALPGSSYIQTFDVSSCVTNNQLKITEITTNYHYNRETTEQVNFDFKMELFLPSSLTAFGPYDIENKVATAQTPVTLTTAMPDTGTLQVTFSNLDITMGCNDKYGFQGHFALFTYPINCANDDDFCGDLEPIIRRGQQQCECCRQKNCAMSRAKQNGGGRAKPMDDLIDIGCKYIEYGHDIIAKSKEDPLPNIEDAKEDITIGMNTFYTLNKLDVIRSHTMKLTVGNPANMYCVCAGKHRGSSMIQCGDRCKIWYHRICVVLSEA
eukprot:342200_1